MLEIFVCGMALVIPKAVWRFIITTHGGQCVMTNSIAMQQQLFAGC